MIENKDNLRLLVLNSYEEMGEKINNHLNEMRENPKDKNFFFHFVLKNKYF